MEINVLEEDLDLAKELFGEKEETELDELESIFNEEGKKYDLTIALLPFFKEFFLQTTREFIKISIESGEENEIIENYILEFSKFMSLTKFEQLDYLHKGIDDTQSKFCGGYFNELFDNTIELMRE